MLYQEMIAMNNTRRHIFGNGISAYVIAAVLDYKEKDFIIHGKGEYKPQPMLYLEVKDNYELSKYLRIFGIGLSDENIKKYTKKVKVGFRNEDGKFLDKPTKNMIDNYLIKQGRYNTPSAMSDGNEEFVAIDLSLIMPLLIEKFKEYVVEEDCYKYEYKPKDIIYNTIIPTKCNENKGTNEYILPRIENIHPRVDIDFDKYDYVYDCKLTSNIKRYSKYFTEYVNPIRDASMRTVINYYALPKIYNTYYVKGNYTIIDISRNATRTQLKQKDIIDYIMKYE